MSLHLLPEFYFFKFARFPSVEERHQRAFQALRRNHRSKTTGPWLLSSAQSSDYIPGRQPFAVVDGTYFDALAQALCLEAFFGKDADVGSISRLTTNAMTYMPDYRLPHYMSPLAEYFAEDQPHTLDLLRRQHKRPTMGIWSLLAPPREPETPAASCLAIVCGSYGLAFDRATTLRPFYEPYNDRFGAPGKIVKLVPRSFTRLYDTSAPAAERLEAATNILTY